MNLTRQTKDLPDSDTSPYMVCEYSLHWSMQVAQFEEWSLLTPQEPGSNPGRGNC